MLFYVVRIEIGIPEKYRQFISEYIKPTMILKVSAYSLIEPYTGVSVNSVLSLIHK